MKIWRCNVWWIEWVNQNFPAKKVTVLPGHQRNMQSRIILMECYAFSIDWFWTFLSNVAFNWSYWEKHLLVFQKELIIENSLPIPQHTQRHLLWMKIGLWCGWWFILLAPQFLPFHITVRYPLLIITITLF